MVGAQSSHTVCGAGSSTALSNAFTAWSVSRSASSTTITCHRRPLGASAALRTSSRVSSHAERHQRRADHPDVGMRADLDLVAALAHPATAQLALQRRGERRSPRPSARSRAVR